MQPRDYFTGALTWSTETILTSVLFANVIKTMHVIIMEKQFTCIPLSENL